jgi:hypothetical protein
VDTVALAATIGGSIVGVAGVLATAWSARQQRLSSIELANSQHEHERALASGARLFEKRAEVYESLLSTLLIWRDRVELIWRERVQHELPRVRTDGEPEPPKPPSQDEWRTMSARVGTFGSLNVDTGFMQMVGAINIFFSTADGFIAARDAGHYLSSEEAKSARDQVQRARDHVVARFEALERLVSDELAGL